MTAHALSPGLGGSGLGVALVSAGHVLSCVRSIERNHRFHSVSDAFCIPEAKDALS